MGNYDRKQKSQYSSIYKSYYSLVLNFASIRLLLSENPVLLLEKQIANFVPLKLL